MPKRTAIQYGLFFLCIYLSPCIAFSQTWERLSGDRFGSIIGAGENNLILLREPGDLLGSTDNGITWHVVYRTIRSLGPLHSLKNGNIGLRIDSGSMLMSPDSGKSWVTQMLSVKKRDETLRKSLNLPSGNRLALRDSKILYCSNASGFWRPVLIADSATVLTSITLIGSRCYAVGEPGVIFVSDTSFKSWTLLTRSPFANASPRLTEASRIDSLPYSSEGIQFVTAASGMVWRGNKIWFTSDSATSWREACFRDTLAASLLLSDKDALIATSKGDILRIQSSTCNGWSTEFKKHISDKHLQMGWFSKNTGEIFIRGDSAIYYSDVGFEFTEGIAFGLPPGSRPILVTFPSKYCGYLLAGLPDKFDSEARQSFGVSLNPIPNDSTSIYRTVDGAATWVPVLNSPVRYRSISFISASRGWVCGEHGNVLWTQDSGATWGEWRLYQDLNCVSFVNDSEGFAAGDSGAVYFSQNGGHQFGATFPEQGFLATKRRFTDVAFSDETTVYILGLDCCYRRCLPHPFEFAFSQTTSSSHDRAGMTAFPNPASTLIRLSVTSSSDRSVPRISILDLAGRCVINSMECRADSEGEWSVLADVSSLSNGYYSAVATIGSTAAYCKFLVIHSN